MRPSQVVLVTGSSGLIGSALVRRLAETYRIVGFDRKGDPHPPKEAECVCLDVTSDESVEAGLARVRYAYGNDIASVVHLAAFYDFSGEPSPLYEEVTVRGTERLLAGLQGFNVGQFLFSSTMLVHRPAQPGQRIEEDWPLEPTWAYPQSKVATEKLISNRRGKIPAVLLRIAGVYDDKGHSPPITHQIARIYERALTSRFYPAEMDRGSSFIHLDDLLEAIVAIIDRRAELPQELPLLVGEEQVTGYGELQELIGCLIHGEAWKTWEIPKTIAKVGTWAQDSIPFGEEPFIKAWMVDRAEDHYALDCTKARTLLDWRPRHSLRETLPAIVHALKKDPVTWYRENGMEPPDDYR
ncbi:MAG: NAD(P)-dependent oxidoreductase [Actinomycetota bacterium]